MVAPECIRTTMKRLSREEEIGTRPQGRRCPIRQAEDRHTHTLRIGQSWPSHARYLDQTRALQPAEDRVVDPRPETHRNGRTWSKVPWGWEGTPMEGRQHSNDC